MKKHLRAGILFLTITMFWGIIYPQYTLTEDMYRVTRDGKAVEKDCPKDYWNIMKAGQGEVELRFALFEKVGEWFGEKKVRHGGCDGE